LDELVVIKDYTNDTLELKIISMWVIDKNMLKTFESPTFA
jgi:hypothetical protein